MSKKGMSKSRMMAIYRPTIQEANKRAAALRRAGENTPALQNLRFDVERIGAKTSNRAIKFNKNMSDEELTNAYLAARKFNKAKSSTVEGMGEIVVNRTAALRDLVKQYDKIGLTKKKLSELYSALNTEEFKRAKGMGLDSNIIVAYFNKRLVRGGYGIDTEDLARELDELYNEINENKIDDPNVYMRRKFGY